MLSAYPSLRSTIHPSESGDFNAGRCWLANERDGQDVPGTTVKAGEYPVAEFRFRRGGQTCAAMLAVKKLGLHKRTWLMMKGKLATKKSEKGSPHSGTLCEAL